MSGAPSVLWLRRDLRRGDLPALGAAAGAGAARSVCVFVLDPSLWASAGRARRAWLAATLRATERAYDGRLCLRAGDPRTGRARPRARSSGLGLCTSRARRRRSGRRRDAQVRQALADAGVDWVETGSPYAVGPGSVLNGSGDPYKVFTPFSRAWRDHGWPRPATEPTGLRLAQVASEDRAWDLVDAALAEPDLPAPAPRPGKAPRSARWAEFLDDALAAYGTDRDRADLDGVSRLSPYLKIGAVHPRTLLADIADRGVRGAAIEGAAALRHRAGLARVLRRRPVAPTRSRPGTTCGRRWQGWPTSRPADLVETVARGPHRLPGRRCGDAPAARRGVDAQPGADGHGELPHQGPARVVAGRAHGTSSTTSSTATSPPTTTAGSGSRAPAPTRRRTSASSTR